MLIPLQLLCARGLLWPLILELLCDLSSLFHEACVRSVTHNPQCRQILRSLISLKNVVSPHHNRYSGSASPVLSFGRGSYNSDTGLVSRRTSVHFLFLSLILLASVSDAQHIQFAFGTLHPVLLMPRHGWHQSLILSTTCFHVYLLPSLLPTANIRTLSGCGRMCRIRGFARIMIWALTGSKDGLPHCLAFKQSSIYSFLCIVSFIP